MLAHECLGGLIDLVRSTAGMPTPRLAHFTAPRVTCAAVDAPLGVARADVIEKGQRSPLSPASLSACERALSLGAHRLLTRASTATACRALSLRWPLTSNLLHRLRSPLMHPLTAAHAAAVAHAFALVHVGCVEHIPKATPGAAHIGPGRVCSRTADSLL